MSEADAAVLRNDAIKIATGTRFSAEDVAKVYKAQGERGVPIWDRTKDGQLLGSKITRQMMGIAIGTGENMEETFNTHLAIQRGFKLPFESFPHISDTIARVHQKTGASLSQIFTQMGQIAGPAGAAGWSEEEDGGGAWRVDAAWRWSVRRLWPPARHRPLAQLDQAGCGQWKKLGIQKSDLVNRETGGIIGPAELAKLLDEHTKGMKPAISSVRSTPCSGDRGVKIATQLLGAHDDLGKLTNDLKTIKDLAEQMGATGDTGPAAGLAKLGASMKNLDIAIMEGTVGAGVGNFAGGLGRVIDSNSERAAPVTEYGRGICSPDQRAQLHGDACARRESGAPAGVGGIQGHYRCRRTRC